MESYQDGHAEQAKARPIKYWPPDGSKFNGLVGPAKQMRILPLVPKLHIVPAGTCAVLTLPGGKRTIFQEGMHVLKDLPAGVCLLRYVDMREHRTPISLTEAWCKDGWRGKLALQIHWRVNDAAHLVDVADPVGNLTTAAKASVRAVIETTPHDKLIGGSDEQAIATDSLAAAVTAKLQDNPATKGIKILRVLITERQGDTRCIEIAQEKTVEHKRQELVLLQEETERKRKEEERKVRIREAEIEAETEGRLAAIKWQQVQLEQAAELNKQHHERALKIIEAYAQVLSKAAELGQLEALGVSSRRRPELATGGLESMLNQGLSNLQSALQAPTISPLPTYASSYNEKAALAARLAAEAAEVAELEGVKQCYVGVCKKEKGNTVFVWLDGRRLSICCPLDYPQTAPKVQWADNGHHKVPLNWSEGMSLSHIVADIRATAQA
jgi:regulator of protease activity HflC (stomatin/prohibitin superfamily)